jgi:hypothetical protein
MPRACNGKNIVGMDLAFYEHLPQLFPHADARSWFVGNAEFTATTALRNSSLQGAYLILAARALGVDCGAMSGFDNQKVDEAFFVGTQIRSNFLLNISSIYIYSVHWPLNVFKKFPYMNEGFRLDRIIDNNKSWVSTDDKLRESKDANYNSYYFINNEKLVLNIKNIDLFLNPGQGLAYEIWEQSRKYGYPIPESGLTIGYPVPGGVDSTVIDPEPQNKTFFEFNQTFWQNLINTRNRQFITDGKTGGYPTLQSLFWKYIQQYQNTGTQNNQYTYQKLIDYVNGLGPNWMKLVEQMIPATTIWQGGTRFENSVLHRQKFVYRRQRGCVISEKFVDPCSRTASLSNYGANEEKITVPIYPWLTQKSTLSSFSAILRNQVGTLLQSNGYTTTTCNGINSLTTEWYVNLTIGSNLLINYKFIPYLKRIKIK